MLPRPVYDDIFNIEFQANQIAIDHICDELEKFGLVTTRLDNFDHAIVIYFTSEQQKVDGELRIDRIRKCFDISMIVSNETILPSSGDWSNTYNYLSACLRQH